MRDQWLSRLIANFVGALLGVWIAMWILGSHMDRKIEELNKEIDSVIETARNVGR